MEHRIGNSASDAPNASNRPFHQHPHLVTSWTSSLRPRGAASAAPRPLASTQVARPFTQSSRRESRVGAAAEPPPPPPPAMPPVGFGANPASIGDAGRSGVAPGALKPRPGSEPPRNPLARQRSAVPRLVSAQLRSEVRSQATMARCAASDRSWGFGQGRRCSQHRLLQ